jgi:hypothetical protein
MRGNARVIGLGVVLLAALSFLTPTVTVDQDTGDTRVASPLLRLFESPVEAQTAFPGLQKTFTTQTATGATAAGFTQTRGIPVNHTAELIVTGAPATCTYRLQGTRDGTTWFDISASAITCTTTTVAFEANKPAVNVRGNLVTLTGGTSPSVTLKYIGK